MDKLIVFLKVPRRGQVKTRLAAALGDEAALAVYRQLLTSVLDTIASLESVELRFTPDEAGSEISPLRRHEHWTLCPQQNGDLGARLVRAFAESFHAGCRRVVVIGSDCPAVTLDDVHVAHSAIADHDLVLGPACDGGYWLIGLRSSCPELFSEMPWGTSSVFDETMRRARALNLKVRILRTLSDVDTADDWQRFLARGE